jgi:HlyD family secretion protein
MRRALTAVAVLATILTVALVIRVREMRARAHGAAGGTGVIEGVDVNVTSRLATRITAIKVREGDTVKRGDALVDLDCTASHAALEQAEAQLQASQAQVSSAQSNTRSAASTVESAMKNVDAANSQQAVLAVQLTLAEQELQRQQQLFKSGAATGSAVDEARTKRDQLASQIAAQKATEGATRAQAQSLSASGRSAQSQALMALHNVDVARAAVDLADLNVRECTLYAPRDGMVTTRILEPGEAVSPGSAVLAITDVTDARTRFYLPNAELAAAAPGKKVRVVADAYPKQTFAGTIFYVSPRAEFTPRNVQTREDRERLVYAVEVRIPNADLKLRSGMPVEVEIEGTRE